MQIIENVSEDLINRAVSILSKKDAMQEAMRVFLTEVAANQLEAAQLWAEVDNAAKAQGIQKAANEAYSFDYVKRQFTITRPPKG